MAYFYSYIKGLIQAAADVLDDGPTKISLGTTGGTDVYYPDSPKKGRKAWTRGLLWLTGQAIPDFILAKIGAALDLQWTAWAEVSTLGAGVPPQVLNAVGVASVTKDEVTDILYANFSPEFLSANYIPMANLGPTPADAYYFRSSKSQCGFRFDDPVTGANLDINSRTVLLVVKGKV